MIDRRRLIAALPLAAAPPLARSAPLQWGAGDFRAMDGATIRFRRRGRGPGLVIVHGAFDTPETWFQTADLLADRFNVFILERRGWRLPPPDDGSRAYDREKADIAVLLGIAGAGSHLFGHSSGGALALDYARSHSIAGRLVVYDPALPLGGPVGGAALAPLKAFIAAGQLDEALRVTLRDIIRVSPQDFKAIAESADWAVMRPLVVNFPREVEAVDALPTDPSAYAAIKAPTSLIVGELSQEHPLHDSARKLAAAWPALRVLTLEGLGHMAVTDAPAKMAAAMQSLLLS